MVRRTAKKAKKYLVKIEGKEQILEIIGVVKEDGKKI